MLRLPVKVLKHIFSFCFLLFAFLANATHTHLRIHIESAPGTLDPAQSTGHREHLIIAGLFEGLTRYHPQTLAPLPGVAEKWSISPDGKTYQFFLRKDAKWSDGKPLTAQDFWNAWKYLLSPKTKSPYASFLYHLKGGKGFASSQLKDPSQIGMRVQDPYLFVVELEKPVPYFLALTSFASLSPRRLGIPRPEKIGNGAFVLSDQGEEGEILLLPNPHYWNKEAVKLHGVLFRPFGDFDTALKFYGRTGIDIMADLPPNKVPLLKFRSDFRSAPILRTEYISLNTGQFPFNRKEVRQALALSIDRKMITEAVLKRGDLPYGFLIPPGLPGYQNPATGQNFDPWKAKNLLDRAGFSPQNKFPTITLLHDPATDRKLIAKAIQEMWQKYLGIQVELVEAEWESYLKKRRQKDYQASWGGWYGDYPDPNTFLELFTSDNAQNHSAWANATYDQLMLAAQNTTNVQERAKFFREAEALLLREAPIIPVLAKVKNYLIQPYVKGYYPNLLDVHPLRDAYSLRP